MIDLLIYSLIVYGITLLLTTSKAGEQLYRNPVKSYLSKTKFFEKESRIENLDYFLHCRMCTGVYVSLVVCLLHGSLGMILPVYGLSYFLATQER